MTGPQGKAATLCDAQNVTALIGIRKENQGKISQLIQKLRSHEVDNLSNGIYHWKNRFGEHRAFISGESVQAEYWDGSAWIVDDLKARNDVLKNIKAAFTHDITFKSN